MMEETNLNKNQNKETQPNKHSWFSGCFCKNDPSKNEKIKFRENTDLTKEYEIKNNGKTNQKLIAQILTNIYTKAEEKLKVEDQCMVCYENFPVSFKFPCGHELCAVCVQSIINIDGNKNCPYCRAPLANIAIEWADMIKINPNYLTPDISLEKLQIAFPLICSASNCTTVTKCVKMGMKINTKGFAGFFPIHLVSEMEVLKYLVKNGANVNQRLFDGERFDANTPLFISSEQGNLPVVQYLVERGAKLNNGDGFAPLDASCEKGHLPVVKYLVEKGAKVNQSDNDGFTPLLMSSQEGHLPVVEYLVKKGAKLNQTNNHGVTPLYMSCHQGHLPVVKYLVEQGANVNQPANDGDTPLAIAISTNQIEITKFLLKKNANITATIRYLKKKNNGSKYIEILDKFWKEIEAEQIRESNYKAKNAHNCLNQ